MRVWRLKAITRKPVLREAPADARQARSPCFSTGVRAAKLRLMARERPRSISPEMLRIADEMAHEASRLEAELIDAEPNFARR
jgi:hypothetical protein